MASARQANRRADRQASPPASQEPAADFRRRLLEGMAAAVRERGFRDATVADVVRHARTSRRTFYEYFPDKQACYIVLLQEANAVMVRQVAAAVDRRAPWDVQIRQAAAKLRQQPRSHFLVDQPGEDIEPTAPHQWRRGDARRNGRREPAR